ncbi:hypothetical protein NYO91_06290 [Arhodomonas aquaeolei]|uniref:hypothetical protein n=1 Tax=Arhodomonas aquaeolei TaxID=2369 RepID=UPI002166CC91|nr:hypothetical protein [Arhodomonas aquaeolei]MCS4503688.1 hypothetical protein [Arhodomonas aquaeolei]
MPARAGVRTPLLTTAALAVLGVILRALALLAALAGLDGPPPTIPANLPDVLGHSATAVFALAAVAAAWSVVCAVAVRWR